MNKSEALIKLHFKEGEKEFLNTDQLREFLESQQNSWSWLQEVKYDGHLGPLLRTYDNYLRQIDNFLVQYGQHEDNKDWQSNLERELISHTQQAVAQGFLLDENPQAKFVAELKERKTPHVAAYALASLTEQNIRFDTVRPAFEGVYWALQFLQGNTDTVKAEQNALESMKKSWDVKFGEQFKDLRSQNDQLIKEITEFRSQSDGWVKSFETEIEESKKRLEGLEHTYNEKLALQSSVQYWGDKRDHHQKIMWWTGGATLLLALATTGAFIWVAFELLKETVGEVPLWKLGIMLAISSFGVWITRLMAKIFISNLHLRTDSHERTTMIQTYLALLREGRGPKDEERQLILQTLFRPSTTGFIKEDGPAGFYETISKALGK